MRNRRTEPFSAPPFAVAHEPEDPGVSTLELSGFRQARNYSCGYAAALMILRYFERDLRGRQLFEELGTARDGTSQSAILRVLRAQGLSVNIRYDADFERIIRAIEGGKPCIAYLIDEEHWIVIYGYGRSPERVFVADPEPNKDMVYPWESYGPRLGGFAMVCSESRARREEVVPAGFNQGAAPRQLPLFEGWV